MTTKSLLLIFALAGAAGLAQAQRPYPRDGYGNPRYNDRGYRDQYSGDYGRGSYRGNVVDRVMSDLSRSGGYGWMDNRDRKRIDRAQRDLAKFQEKWSRGKFDRGKLDSAIDNLQHVVNSSRFDPRSRDRLARDLYDLRDFRSRGAYQRDYYRGRPY